MMSNQTHNIQVNGSPYLYEGIPSVDTSDKEYLPAKLFVVDRDVMPMLGPRVFIDGSRTCTGTINTLDGPANNDGFHINVPFDKLRKILITAHARRGESKIPISGNRIPSPFTFGIVDIVVFPFFYALSHSIKIDSSQFSEFLWKANSNIITQFFPRLREFSSAITIGHFDEQPIDDAPIHNLLIWHSDDSNFIMSGINYLLSLNMIPTHFVSASTPLMDDRYALHARRPQDGEPFNLLSFAKIVGWRSA